MHIESLIAELQELAKILPDADVLMADGDSSQLDVLSMYPDKETNTIWIDISDFSDGPVEEEDDDYDAPPEDPLDLWGCRC